MIDFFEGKNEKKMRIICILSLCLFSWIPNVIARAAHVKNKLQIAIISDAHIQDTLLLRSMDAQLHSTRLFNENYFAFTAALEDVAKRGIRYVILPGDMTDNGQQRNIELVNRILRLYAKNKNMNFFVMTGNHDPARPFTVKDSLGDMKWWGYKEIMHELSDWGFSPRPDYMYWETPFSSYSYPDYAFKTAAREADISRRTYRIEGVKSLVPDASYLVEPLPGLWLLAIDASVYPVLKATEDHAAAFGAARVGYTEIFQRKGYLLSWIKKITAQARKYNKTLITFSHYPMVDYNRGSADFLKQLAPTGFDLDRIPSSGISDTLADAGVKLHLGGHLHLNDEAVHVSRCGNTLKNIQIPSIAGYLPAYKIVEIDNNTVVDVKTVVLDSVPGFNHFFARYRAEHDSLARIGYKPLWSDTILTASNYKEFCSLHLRDLVQLRYINSFVPVCKNKFMKMTGKQLYSSVGLSDNDSLNWCAADLLTDLFKVRFGGELALDDISKQRLKEYKVLFARAVLSKGIGEEELFLFNLSNAFLSLLKEK